MDAAGAHLISWLDQHAVNRTVTAFLSYGAEPPTGRLLAALHARGYRVLVPICEPERRLSWAAWHPGIEMARCAVAPIDEPVGPRFDASVMPLVDAVLVPAQAVDSQGDRLGQGGGYYDRFIASLDGAASRPALLAVVYEHELMEAGSFPVQGFDRRVDAVFTATGRRNFGERAPRDGLELPC